MDINSLETFIEVAEKKSFSKSAESLQLTQPAVSKRIASLEAILSAKLFDRVGGGITLTEAGRALLPSAQKISTEVAKVANDIKTLGKEVSGKLSIATVEHVGLVPLVPLLKAYKKQYPGVELDIHVTSINQALGDIECGKLDLMFNLEVNSQPADERLSSLSHIEVWSDTLRVAVEPDHPLTQLGDINIANLADYTAIVPPQSSSIRLALDRMMLRGVERRVTMESPDFSNAKSMAAVGLGWTVLPASELDDSLSVVDVPDLQLNYSVAAVRSMKRTISRATLAFLESLPSHYSMHASSARPANEPSMSGLVSTCF